MKQIDKDIKKLAKLNVDKYVRKASGACEENVKIKIVIPLLNLLGYSTEEDMDFEHHVQNKKADIALLFDNTPKLIVETKDLDEQLDHHVNQGLNYAYYKGIEWVILTNGLETRIYKSFIPGISDPKDRLLFITNLQKLPDSFGLLFELVSKEHLQEAKKLSEKAESVRESITAQILIADLAECRKRLFNDLVTQFKSRYQTDVKFKELIEAWATQVKMDISDPNLIGKLCMEGAYTLINRVLFLRICEDRGHIKPKLSKDSITKWREMVERPTNLLSIAFKEIGERFEGLYKSPLFDSISFEDINWNSDTINFVLDKLGEQDFSKISKDILGKAYEQHISGEERKELGQFYTPDFIIDYILDKVCISPKKKILDPACGSGGFLIRAYDRLRKQYEEEGWAEDVVHEQILKTNLFGIDINPFATQLTVMNLLLKDLNHPTGEINVVEGDTLEKLEEKLDLDIYHVESPLAYITKTDKKLTYTLLLQHRPFNMVVGNPPYISFGLRGVGKITEGQYKYLKSNYPNSAEYKISMYAVFIERGLQLLDQGGRFGFVVPDSFLLGRYFSKLRRYILDNCKIIEIVLFTKDFWEYGVVGRPVIIVLEKESNKDSRLSNKLVARLCHNVADTEHFSFKSYAYKQNYFESVPYNRFRLFFDSFSKNLVARVERDSIPLSNFVTIHTGVRSKIGQKNIVSTNKQSTSWQRGLISGSEIGRYSLKYGGHFLNIDSKLLWSGGFEPRVILNDKLLLRQTGDSLIATFDSDKYYHLNNIHAISPKEPFGVDELKYILALLNSRLMNHYYHLISLEFGRAMAQTDIETIEQLPIKQPSKGQQDEIVNLVNKILALNKELSTADKEESLASIKAEIEKVDKEIDTKVYQLYDIKVDWVVESRGN